MGELSVLLIRPIQANDGFAAQLVAAGASLHRCPVMAIDPLSDMADIEAIKQQILNFDAVDIAIFVSRNAARLGLDWLGQYWPMLPTEVSYYAVGKSTAALLAEYDIAAISPEAEMTSEGLLSLASLQNINGKRVLLFCGVGGRETLVDELELRGTEVARCNLYRRTAVTNHADEIAALLSGSEVNMVVAHSAELLKNLLDMSSPEQCQVLTGLPLLVPSNRVATAASNEGFEDIIVAASALPDDMVSAVRGWYSNR